jgi:hypothetical protein
MTHIHVVTTHNMTMKPEAWHAVKGRIISRHGTISALAALLKHHPNAIRGAVEGRCPKVRRKLQKRGLL